VEFAQSKFVRPSSVHIIRLDVQTITMLPRVWVWLQSGFWIDDRIYWTLLLQRVTTLYSPLLHRHTSVHSHVFTSRCLVAASNGGRSPSSGFPNCPQPQLPASHSNRTTEPQQSSNSLTHSLTKLLLLHCLSPRLAAISHQTPTLLTAVKHSILIAAGPCYTATARTVQKTPLPTPLYSCMRVCRGHYLASALFAEPLLSNGCCIAAYFAVVA
jgi:hypothetical protein